MNTNYKSIILAIGLFLVLPTSVSAAPGDLDPTFGNGGIVVTGGFAPNLEVASAMAIQSDGKIVVVGEGSNGSFNWDFAVARYNVDGALDSSFGGNGRIITRLTGDYDAATAVAIQADGKIIVAGIRYDGAGGSSIAVVRYNPNGSLDTSFNGTGMVITTVGSSHANSLAIQTDGKIVVAGQSDNSFAIVRYNSNGSLDTSFNGTGKVITPVGGGANSVAIQSDGKIIAAGSTGNFTLVRYNPNGSLDTTFNGTGIVITPVGNSNSGAGELVIQTDGKIVAAGVGNNGSNNNFAVIRYNLNGSLDTSFGGTGQILIPVGNSSSTAYSVAIQSDGKVVAVGDSGNSDTGTDFAAVRLNPNGSLDTTFGGTGKVITPIVNQDFISFATAIAIQADGKIVAAGSTDSGFFDFYDFAVVRYQGGSNSNIRTRFDFDGDGKADVSVFRPSDRIWYLNQSTNGFSATQFGLSTDLITPADFDGDGKTDISVYRGGTWYWLESSDNSFNTAQFGIASDKPVPADYTGDGRSELAIYRNGVWWALDLTNNQTIVVQFGISTDKPVVADYDGDGRADQAISRNGEWHLNRSSQGYAVVSFGLSTDKAVPADYDGDGRQDQAVYRDGTWYVLQSSNGYTEFRWGIASDIPAPADYDGDGKTDAAVFRDGTWYLRQTTNGISIQQFGLTNDKPVPAAFLP